jgi:glycosyltransferase involved in cell wall biosynthesis
MKPIHICHIVQSGGGVETYILNLMWNCDRYRFRHTVVTYTNGTLSRTAKEAGAETISIPMVREIAPAKDLISFLRILSAVTKLKPNIIHAHSAKGGIFGRLCGMLLHIPAVFTPHAFSYLGQKGLRRYIVLTIERLLAHTPTLLVASSYSEAVKAIKEVGWNPKKVISTFPDSIEIGEKKVEHTQKETFKVLMIGRLSYQKNPEMFLRVARVVNSCSNAIEFTILGGGYGEELGAKIMRMMSVLNLEKVVQIKAWTRPSGVEEELLKSDIYVSTSRYESFGYTTAEAMEKCLPVVATKIDGTADLVEHGRTGYLVNVGEDEQMAAYIIRLANNCQLRQCLGEAGRERIRGLYDIKKNIDAIESTYCILSKRGSAQNEI